MTDTTIGWSNEAPPKLKEKIKMKTRNLLITLGAAAFAAITINATASNALLSPRAAGSQIQQISGTTGTANLVSASTATISPRAAGNQIVTVAGTLDEANSAVACAKTMNGTPKAVAQCTSHTTMPNCKPVTVADAK
jgi:hypothetical protein